MQAAGGATLENIAISAPDEFLHRWRSHQSCVRDDNAINPLGPPGKGIGKPLPVWLWVLSHIHPERPIDVVPAQPSYKPPQSSAAPTTLGIASRPVKSGLRWYATKRAVAFLARASAKVFLEDIEIEKSAILRREKASVDNTKQRKEKQL